MADLLPCPFCGSNDVSRSLGEKGDGSPWEYIECGACAAMTEPEMWNRRSVPVAAETLLADYQRQEDDDWDACRRWADVWRAQLGALIAEPEPKTNAMARFSAIALKVIAGGAA